MESIVGMLRACEDQTERWDWMKQLRPIAAILSVEERSIFETIPSTILQGLMTTLPLVQHLPEDRYITIRSPRGACSMVAWAHILLGLEVSVEIDDQKGLRTVQFPPNQQGVEHIFIKMPDSHSNKYAYDPSITLLSAVEHHELLRLKAENDEEAIDATIRRPARGIVTHLVSKYTPSRDGRDRVIEEVGNISCGLALCVIQHLYRVGFTSYSTVPGTDKWRSQPHAVDHECLFNAARVLYDIREEDISERKAYEYEFLFAEGDFLKIDDPGSTRNLASLSSHCSQNLRSYSDFRSCY